mgnify:CR=1 FL=1
MPKAKQSMDFEASLAQLEALVSGMEAGALTLEESLQHFEQGIRLTRDCQERLTAAEQQVQVLLEQQGEPNLRPFDSDLSDNNASDNE